MTGSVKNCISALLPSWENHWPQYPMIQIGLSFIKSFAFPSSIIFWLLLKTCRLISCSVAAWVWYLTLMSKSFLENLSKVASCKLTFYASCWQKAIMLLQVGDLKRLEGDLKRLDPRRMLLEGPLSKPPYLPSSWDDGSQKIFSWQRVRDHKLNVWLIEIPLLTLVYIKGRSFRCIIMSASFVRLVHCREHYSSDFWKLMFWCEFCVLHRRDFEGCNSVPFMSLVKGGVIPSRPPLWLVLLKLCHGS